MLENNFDKQIRDKIESVKPVYNEAAWQKLSKALPMPWYTTLFKHYGGWLYGGLATVILLSNYISNQAIKGQNKLLKDHIAAILVTKQMSDTIYVQNRVVDTIFVTKYISQKILMPVYVANNDVVIQKESNDNSLKNEVLENNAIVKSENGIELNNNKKNKNLNNKVKKEIAVNNENKIEILKNSQVADVFEKTEEKNELNQPKTGLPEVKIPELPQLAGADLKTTEEPHKDVKLLKPETSDLIIPQTEPLKIEKPAEKSFLKNVNARLGIAFDFMGRNSASVGPTLEVLLGNKLSINTGLLVTEKEEKGFRLPRDFNQGTGKIFEARYERYIKEKPQKIEDISINTAIFKIPVFVTYYMPLKNNINAMFSTGTKLDVSVIENITYNDARLGEKIRNNFENQYKPKVFNSIFFASGLQFKYERLFGQVIPYYELPFRQASYLSIDRNFGINASIKVALRK
jgi:hypothetical protein